MIDGMAAFRALLLADPALMTLALDGIETVPPGRHAAALETAEAPTGVDIQQLDFTFMPGAPLATFNVLVKCYAPDATLSNALARAVTDATLERDGFNPRHNVTINDPETGLPRWFLFWVLQSGSGADLEEEAPRWPMTVLSFQATFDALRGA